MNPRPAAAKAAKKAAKKRTMSDAHKEALAVGRAEGTAVRRYLKALDANRPKRGRKRTPESISNRLRAIESKLADADTFDRIHLIQEKMDLQKELEAKSAAVDLGALEEDFVKAAKSYGERKGITYAAWRAAGVPPALLAKAGIKRGS